MKDFGLHTRIFTFRRFLSIYSARSLYIYPFSGRFHKFVRKDVRHRGCVKLVRRLRKNLYLFDTFHAYRDFSFRLIYI